MAAISITNPAEVNAFTEPERVVMVRKEMIKAPVVSDPEIITPEALPPPGFNGGIN